MEFINQLIASGTTFPLILVRVGAFMTAFPWLGGRGVPMSIRVMLALGISMVLFPILEIEIPAALGFPALALGILGEVLIGAVIGLGARLVFTAVDVGAELIGIQMGFSMARLLDPSTQQRIPLIGQLEVLLVMMIFFLTNAHHFIFQALFYSFERVPSMGFYPSGSIVEHLMQLAGEMFSIGLKIGVPVTMALLLTNISLGILFRVVPQMNVFLLGFPITISVGLLVLGASLPLFAGLMQGRIDGLERLFSDLLIEMQGHR